MSRRDSIRGRWRVTVAAAILLLLPACSSKEKDEGATPTTAVEPSTTAPSRIIGGPFCEHALGFNEQNARVGPELPNPQQLRTTFEQAAKTIEDAERVAPAEVKADVEVLASTFRQFVTALEQVNFDFTKLPPAQIATLQSSEVTAAGERLDAYVRQNCRRG